MIEFERITKSFDGGKTHVVNGVTFDVNQGETLVLLGSSGCGKTTTLKMINRLIEPCSGIVRVEGENVQTREVLQLRRSIGYVFQGIGLFPHLTVAQNVMLTLRLVEWPEHQRHDRIREVLDLVELNPDEFGDRYPSDLSGGQQQRVGVARALAGQPKIMLMDEPFGALDALTRDTLQQALLKLKSALSKTIVFVTHDIMEALILADRIGVMHEGQLEQIDTPERLVSNPQTPFVASLFESPKRQLDVLNTVGHS